MHGVYISVVRTDDEDDEAEQLSPRHGARIVYTNGNGQVNKIMWAGAALFVAGIVTINGFMWKAQIDSSREVAERLARLEAQMTIVLQRP